MGIGLHESETIFLLYRNTFSVTLIKTFHHSQTNIPLLKNTAIFLNNKQTRTLRKYNSKLIAILCKKSLGNPIYLSLPVHKSGASFRIDFARCNPRIFPSSSRYTYTRALIEFPASGDRDSRERRYRFAPLFPPLVY